jgi:hypothetical protein
MVPAATDCSGSRPAIELLLSRADLGILLGAAATVSLTTFEIGIDPVKIVPMLRGICIACRIDLSQHLIFPQRRDMHCILPGLSGEGDPP